MRDSATECKTCDAKVLEVTDIPDQNDVPRVPIGRQTVQVLLRGRQNKMRTKLHWLIGAATLALAAGAGAQNTKFLAWDEEFEEYGDWAVQNFRLSAPRTFRLRAATDYQADVVVIPASQLSAFQDGDDFFGYGFDDEFGNMTISLPKGNYYLAVRNQSDGYNYARVELDHLLVNVPGWRYHSWGIDDTDYLEPRYRYWSEFSVSSTFRYFMDGANIGLRTYVMRRDQLTRFRQGRSFSYFTTYSKNNTDMPGFYELKLSAGNYVLGFVNPYNDYIAFTYEAERWSRGSAPRFNSSGPAPEVGPIATKSGRAVRMDAAEPSFAAIGTREAVHPGLGEGLSRAFGEKPKAWFDAASARRAKPAPRESFLSRAFGAQIKPVSGR